MQPTLLCLMRTMTLPSEHVGREPCPLLLHARILQHCCSPCCCPLGAQGSTMAKQECAGCSMLRYSLSRQALWAAMSLNQGGRLGQMLGTVCNQLVVLCFEPISAIR